MERVWEAIIPYEFEGLHVYCLSTEHQLLHLFLHLHGHLMSGNATLYWFCDIHAFIGHYTADIHWDKFHAIASSLGITLSIAAVYDLLVRYWKTDPGYIAFCSNRDLNTPDLKSLIFNNGRGRHLLIFPSRIRLLREIKDEYGRRKSIYYLLRHLFPVSAHIINRYNPRNQQEMCGYYAFHLYQRVRRALGLAQKLSSRDAFLR